MDQQIQQDLFEFKKNNDQLVNVSSQKQQMQFQNQTIQKALDELKKTKEKKVYKAVGNILILSDTNDVKKELEEQNESLELRVKTLQKQEDALIEKLNSLKSKIETATKNQEKSEEKTSNE